MNIPPQKPWLSGDSNLRINNRPALNNEAPQIHPSLQNIPNKPSFQTSSSSPVGGTIRTVGPPPPLAPRQNRLQYPVQQQLQYYGSNYGMSPYSSGYGGYGGYSNYGSFSGYGGPSGFGGYGMSGYGYGYGRPMNPLNDFENRFIQLAEESSRPAFQSIESLVRAFSSVSMMLESTFHAMYSSFRAVIGVAENFSRLRQLFAQFFSAIAILKFAKNFLRRLLCWFGISTNEPSKEGLWQRAQHGASTEGGVVPSRTVWPVFAFLGLLFGGPYLMSKLLGESITNSDKRNLWNPQEEPGMFIVGIHPFQAASNSELSFQRGQTLQLAPTRYYNPGVSSGWLLAADLEGNVGFIPSNYVTRMPRTMPVNNIQTQYTVPLSSEAVHSNNTETKNEVTNPVSSETKTTKQQ